MSTERKIFKLSDQENIIFLSSNLWFNESSLACSGSKTSIYTSSMLQEIMISDKEKIYKGFLIYLISIKSILKINTEFSGIELVMAEP